MHTITSWSTFPGESGVGDGMGVGEGVGVTVGVGVGVGEGVGAIADITSFTARKSPPRITYTAIITSKANSSKAKNLGAFFKRNLLRLGYIFINRFPAPSFSLCFVPVKFSQPLDDTTRNDANPASLPGYSYNNYMLL